jgi:hypothetical protein
VVPGGAQPKSLQRVSVSPVLLRSPTRFVPLCFGHSCCTDSCSNHFELLSFIACAWRFYFYINQCFERDSFQAYCGICSATKRATSCYAQQRYSVVAIVSTKYALFCAGRTTYGLNNQQLHPTYLSCGCQGSPVGLRSTATTTLWV